VLHGYQRGTFRIEKTCADGTGCSSGRFQYQRVRGKKNQREARTRRRNPTLHNTKDDLREKCGGPVPRTEGKSSVSPCPQARVVKQQIERDEKGGSQREIQLDRKPQRKKKKKGRLHSDSVSELRGRTFKAPVGPHTMGNDVGKAR